MIVCLCHRVSDRDIQLAVESGTLSFDELQADLRVALSCGCCRDSAREVFNQACCGGWSGARAHSPATGPRPSAPR